MQESLQANTTGEKPKSNLEKLLIGRDRLLGEVEKIQKEIKDLTGLDSGEGEEQRKILEFELENFMKRIKAYDDAIKKHGGIGKWKKLRKIAGNPMVNEVKERKNIDNNTEKLKELVKDGEVSEKFLKGHRSFERQEGGVDNKQPLANA